MTSKKHRFESLRKTLFALVLSGILSIQSSVYRERAYLEQEWHLPLTRSPSSTSASLTDLKKVLLSRCTSDSTLKQILSGKPWAADEYTWEKINQLRSGNTHSLSQQTLGQSETQVLERFQSFEFRSRGASDSIVLEPQLNITESDRDTLELALSGSFHKSGDHSAVGYFVVTFEKKTINSEAHPYLDLIKLDTKDPSTRGLGSAFTEFLGTKLKALGHPNIYLEADWAGRGFWAKQGFTFDPDYMVLVNGQKMSQMHVARENLRRFVQYHGFTLNDLALRGPPDTPLKSWEDLNLPEDFLRVVEKTGKKVEFQPYLDEGVLSPKTSQDLGSAFMQWDYRQRPNQEVRIENYDEDLVSDIAMPYWKGVKNF